MTNLDTKTADDRLDFNELHHALQTAAAEVRGTLRRTAILTAVWRWLALLGAAFVLDLSFGLPVIVRWFCLAVLVGFAAYTANKVLRAQLAFRHSDEWAARVVEERLPDADNALINGVQFERMLADGGHEPDVSALMRLEVQRARKTTRRLEESSTVVDRGPERKAAKVLAIAAGAWCLVGILFPGGFMAVMPRLFAPWQDDITPPWSATKFDVQPQGSTVRFGDSLEIAVTVSGQMPNDVALMISTRGQSKWQRLEMTGDEPGHYTTNLESLAADTQYYVQANTGRSARYWITVAKPPVATAVQATYTLPRYTGRPAYTEAVGAGGIHGLQGTTVDLQVTSNRALASGAVHVIIAGGTTEQSDTIVPLVPLKAQPTIASGQFTIDRPGEFQVDLQASDGQSTLSAEHGKIVLDINARPNVWIPQPGHNLLVTPTMSIPVRIEAQDQNALASIALHRVINDLDDNPVVYPITGLPKLEIENSAFNLADLGVRAGDVIKYYAEASDNQPGTPNVGVSQTYTVTVVTPEQFQKALQQERTPSAMKSEAQDMVAATQRLAQQQQALAQQMSQVARQLAKKPGDPALTKQMKVLAAQQKQLQQQASKLAQQMKQYAQSPSASPFERALKQKVAEAAAKIAAAAQSMQSACNSTNPGQQAAAAQQAAQQMAKANAQVQQQIQRAAEKLMKMWPLYNDVERFFALLTAQGELVLRARQFQDHSASTPADQAEMRDIANQQDQIDQALVQLQADFRVHADQAQSEFPKAAAAARRIAAEIDQRRIPPLMGSARDGFRRGDGPTGFQRANDALAQMQAMVQHLKAAQGGQQQELSDSLSLTLGTKGLGSSLKQMAGSGFGMGSGTGNGMGIGVGGMMDGANGMPGGSSPATSTNAPQAYTPPTNFMNGTGGPDKVNHRNTIPGAGAPLSPNDVEITHANPGAPPKPGNQNTTSFPATYRKLISDYYRSVANGQ